MKQDATRTEPIADGESLLMLRWVLIVATGALLLVRHERGFTSDAVIPYVCVYMLSNVVFGWLLRRGRAGRLLEMGLVLFDAIAVSMALLLARDASIDFFLLYFVVLLLAALTERMEVIGSTAALITFIHLYGRAESVGVLQLLADGDVVRLPFLFVVAIFFGHLVERARKAERAAARAQDERKLITELMTRLAGDLKRPLGMVQAMAEVLLEPHQPPLDDEQTELVRRIHADARYMLRIAQNLRDAKQIREGDVVLQRQRASLGDIVEQALHSVASAAALKGVTIERELAPVPRIELDVVQMDRVVWNLLDNAIRCATVGGEVFVALESLDGAVRLSVSDDGQGIDPERLDTLFEPSTGEPRQGFHGPGLGLFIAKTIVDAHGGRIEADSDDGVGATFTVSLPSTETKPALREMADAELVLQPSS